MQVPIGVTLLSIQSVVNIMNERIEKLAMQANNHHGNFFDLNYKELDVFLEKFAELIVKECSYLADQAHHKATNGKSAGGYIRQQFGVEE